MTPISKLPWNQTIYNTSRIEATNSRYAVADCFYFEDLHFILHACNAYPKLVQHIKDNLECGCISDPAAVVEAETLLIELRELP